MNQAYADLYRYDPDEMVGEHWVLIYPDEETDRVHEDILLAVYENEVWRGETIGLRSDGTTFVEDHTLVNRDDGGLICSIRDANERTSQPNEYPTLTTEVLDTSDVGTVVFDEDANVVWTNGTIEEFFGIERSELLGRKQETVVHEKTKHLFADSDRYVEHAFGDDMSGEGVQFRILDSERTDERWVERWKQPIETGPYEGGWVLHYADITRRKRHERELQRQNERLEEFAGVLSHDLRNPLSIARTYGEMLPEDADAEVVGEIRRALDRMESIIEDVLALAREGESVEETESVELASAAAEAWEHVQTRDATLRVAADRSIEADGVRSKRLFENLFRNAVEHGGDDVTVVLGDLPEGFFVADDGPGIPESEREAVFESGFSTDEEGTGFGLSIVRQIASAHGWRLRVTGSDDGGARFEVTDVTVADR